MGGTMGFMWPPERAWATSLTMVSMSIPVASSCRACTTSDMLGIAEGAADTAQDMNAGSQSFGQSSFAVTKYSQLERFAVLHLLSTLAIAPEYHSPLCVVPYLSSFRKVCCQHPQLYYLQVPLFCKCDCRGGL